MRLAVYLTLVLPALFALLAGPLSARLDPRHATWLLTGAAVALAGCSTLALGLLGAARIHRGVRGTAGARCRLETPNTAAVWLTASASVLRDRIYSASRFSERTAEEKVMVEKFLGRTERYNQLILNAVHRLGLTSIDTSAAPSARELIKQCPEVIG